MIKKNTNEKSYICRDGANAIASFWNTSGPANARLCQCCLVFCSPTTKIKSTSGLQKESSHFCKDTYLFFYIVEVKIFNVYCSYSTTMAMVMLAWGQWMGASGPLLSVSCYKGKQHFLLVWRIKVVPLENNGSVSNKRCPYSEWDLSGRVRRREKVWDALQIFEG